MGQAHPLPLARFSRNIRMCGNKNTVKPQQDGGAIMRDSVQANDMMPH